MALAERLKSIINKTPTIYNPRAYYRPRSSWVGFKRAYPARGRAAKQLRSRTTLRTSSSNSARTRGRQDLNIARMLSHDASSPVGAAIAFLFAFLSSPSSLRLPRRLPLRLRPHLRHRLRRRLRHLSAAAWGRPEEERPRLPSLRSVSCTPRAPPDASRHIGPPELSEQRTCRANYTKVSLAVLSSRCFEAPAPRACAAANTSRVGGRPAAHASSRRARPRRI